MTTSIRYALKITSALYVVVFFLPSAIVLADNIVTAKDISQLAEQAEIAIDTFMQESFGLRMRHEFNGKFTNQKDRVKLQKIAKKASDNLEKIAQKQTKLGLTGLWRKLAAELYMTDLSRCEVDYYLGLGAEQPQKKAILHKIMARLESLQKSYNTSYSQFLKAKTLALLARTDPSYKQSAQKEFDILMSYSEMNCSTAFRTEIEKIKLFGPTEVGQLDILAEELAQSSCADDLELILSLAFVQRRYESANFEKIVRLWPQAEDFLHDPI